MQTFFPPTHTAALVITLGVQYVAPARMPRELRHAGFKVAMLAPPNAWAAQTRFIEQLGHLPIGLTHGQAPGVFAGVLQKITPQLILPGDDAILMTLMQTVVDARMPVAAVAADAPAENPLTPLGETMVALIEHSLGNVAHYAASVDKALLVDRARAAGVPVPPGDAVGGIDDALRVASALGYPVIMRPTIGTSSVGVAICQNERELTVAMLALPFRSQSWPEPAAPALVQKYLTGRRYNRAVVGWRGEEIAGYTRTAIERWPNNLGAASVATAVRSPAVADASAKITRMLDMSGFAGIQFIDDADTGKPCLIETNRRMVPATHAGKHWGVDLAAALAAAVQGHAWSGPTDTPEDQQHSMALFPQEWKRDFNSPHLDTLPTDAPWDDPKLFSAMLTAPR